MPHLPVRRITMTPMGLEAECTVRVGRKTFGGVALLEGETLLFRGEHSLRIPFDDIKDIGVEGGELVVRTADTEARFEIGAPIADRWLRLIKEPKGLFEKLEVGPASRVAVVDVHDSLFLTALRERTASVAEGRVPEGAPIVFFGAETRDALRKLPLLRARMIATGALWVIRPKGSKTISEADVFEVVRASGLVDTKVVAFSKTHTAHKCVIPLELRGKSIPQRPPVLTIPPSAPSLKPKKAAAKAKPVASAKKKVAPKKPPTKTKKSPKPTPKHKTKHKTKKGK
jgi:hypothetical protein